MRFLLSIVCLVLITEVWGQTPAPWHFSVSTGATGYVGAPDGPSSQGTFLTTLAAQWDVNAHLRLTGGANQGQFGLTSTPLNRSIEQIRGGFLGVQLHPNWSQAFRLNPTLGFALGRYHSAVWSDELDANGDAYWVWSDGQLYDMEEGALYAQWQAQPVLPDFEPETQTAATQQWGLPIRLGLDWQVSDAWTVEASGCMIMGMQPALAQIAAPTTQALTTFSIGIGWRPGSTLFQDPAIPREYLARRRDSDGDGVTDFRDACFSTPKGVAVDAMGCPVDSDEDGVADHLDLEANSVGAVDLQGRQVNLNGPAPSFPATIPLTQLDFKQVVAEPSTGRRPHLPIGQAFEAPALQPIDNR